MSRRDTNPGDSHRYYEWLDHAQIDLHVARLLRSNGAPPKAVAYHCHQVAEKALKSYLLFKIGKHFDGHNITYLVRQAAKHDRRFDALLRFTPPFNRYYIEARYPTDLPFVISEKDEKEAFELAEKLYRLVARDIAGELKKDIEG